MKDIGGAIRAGYKAKGMTQDEFAKAVMADIAAHPEDGCRHKIGKVSITYWCSLTPAVLRSIGRVLADDPNFFDA